MAKAAVRSKAVVLVLLVRCVLFSPVVCGFCVWSLLCYALYGVLSSFAIILTRKRAGCFTLQCVIVNMSCDGLCSVTLPHGTIRLVCSIS